MANNYSDKMTTADIMKNNDIDAFMKVILASDEKTSEAFIAELNLMAAKYINSDNRLKGKIAENDYNEYDWSYIYNLKRAKIDHFKRRISQIFIEMTESYEIAEILATIKDFNPASFEINRLTCLINDMDKYAECIYFTLSEDHEDPAKEFLTITPICSDESLKTVRIEFGFDFDGGNFTINVNIPTINFSKKAITKLVSYFALSNPDESIDLEATLSNAYKI